MTIGRSKKVEYGSAELEKDFGPLTFADLLTSYRLGEELTRSEVAKKLGVSRQRLCDLEKGRRLPSIKSAQLWAKKLGFSPTLWVQVVLQDQLRRENVDLKVSVA
jgi:transcriptional regulator with XRE-family HTH domain